MSKKSPQSKVRILALDLETSPSMGYFFGLFKQNIGLSQLVDYTEVLTWGAKWVGDPKTKYQEGSLFYDGKGQMLQRVWDLLDEADFLIGWNSKNFDLKHLNREFLLAGMTPPSPVKNIDLMLETKKNFRFLSNKLQHVSTQLGLAGKSDAGGFATWVGCMQNDEQSYLTMLKYQKQDVLLLEDIYDRLLPWIAAPNLALFNDDDRLCPKCGAKDSLRKEGFKHTTVARYQRFVCTVCHSWSQGKKNLASVDQRPVFNG